MFIFNRVRFTTIVSGLVAFAESKNFWLILLQNGIFNDLSGNEIDIVLNEFCDSFNRTEQLLKNMVKRLRFMGMLKIKTLIV